MARRRQVDVFLLLYLTAIVGLAVVSRDREQIDSVHRQQNERLLTAFIPPLPVLPEADTVRYYVSADKTSGIVNTASQPFSMKVFVHDIDPENEVTMTLHSVVFEGELISPDYLRIGERNGYGDLSDRIVYFPITGRFPKVGTYSVNLRSSANRIYRSRGGTIEYHGTVLDSAAITPEQLYLLEHTSSSIVVRVIDTSIVSPKAYEPLRVEASRSSIYSAVGFKEENSVTVNLGWNEPEVTIVSGGGALQLVSVVDKQVEYLWTGRVGGLPDTVVVEARLHRDAGGKDIARTKFTVSGTSPFLFEALPRHLYAGEEMSVNLKVQGLEDEEKYIWSLFERIGAGDSLSKISGKGSQCSWRIPSSYAGKELTIEARYFGRLYPFVSGQTHRSGISRFSLPVLAPPVHISTSFPRQAAATATFRFAASRYSHPRFKGEQPIGDLAEVSVEIVSEKKNILRTSVSMIRKGEFEFYLRNSSLVESPGEMVLVTIRAADAVYRHSMRLTR